MVGCKLGRSDIAMKLLHAKFNVKSVIDNVARVHNVLSVDDNTTQP